MRDPRARPSCGVIQLRTIDVYLEESSPSTVQLGRPNPEWMRVALSRVLSTALLWELGVRGLGLSFFALFIILPLSPGLQDG